jgi:hypothetical protein
MMKTKKKNLKPIDLDIHFKYRCTNSKCNYDHWLTLKETQTKDFKIVCDCGCVLRVKLISKIKILYAPPKQKTQEKPTKQIEIVHKPKIRVDLQAKCVKLLCGYGFTKDESLILTDKAFERNPTGEAGSLIKYILQNLGELNVNN